jgi:hypothetical protein
MRPAIICGAAMALTVTAASASEEDHSANYWLPRCKAFVEAREVHSSEERSARLTGFFCAGMVRGGWSGSTLNGGVIRSIPDGVTTMQVVRVVVSYIEAGRSGYASRSSS